MVRINKRRKGRLGDWANRYVPVPYDRIVSQLIHEALHGEIDKSHEARRRQEYALRVLNAFGDEIYPRKGQWASFRPKSLTPILQRQLWGVEDCYAPSVQDAVASSSKFPTISDATRFYLADDPTDPAFCATYLRNICYVTLARWHLAILLGKVAVGDEDAYVTFRENTDSMVQQLVDAGDDQDDGDDMEVPGFRQEEVIVIMEEHLSSFFVDELEQNVSETFAVSTNVPNHLP